MTFSDSTYGGQDQALPVALAYRDAVIKVVPPMTLQIMRMMIRKNWSRGSRIPVVYYTAPVSAASVFPIDMTPFALGLNNPALPEKH